MKTLKELDIKNKKVLIRVDFNAPIENGSIMDTFRLDATSETINYCLSQNASVILMSHLGRPKNNDPKFSLYPFLDYLENKFNVYVHFSDDCISNKSIEVSNKMLKREIHLIENLRYYDQEIENDINFAQKLSNHADVYINDAFACSHRAHASIEAISHFMPSYCGDLLEEEIINLQEVIHEPLGPALTIIGGSKISTKITVLKNLSKNHHKKPQ